MVSNKHASATGSADQGPFAARELHRRVADTGVISGQGRQS